MRLAVGGFHDEPVPMGPQERDAVTARDHLGVGGRQDLEGGPDIVLPKRRVPVNV